jgi:hypothetical protein
VTGAMAALKAVRVDGNRATIRTTTGSRMMVYVAGHWQDSLSYTITATDPGIGTLSITHNADGSISRTCHPARKPGCSPSGTW